MSEMAIPLTHNWVGEEWDWPLQHNDGAVKLLNSANEFEVHLDCHYFSPKEIEVRVAGENLFIHARHAIRSDGMGGEISREVNRSYKLPKGVEPRTMKSSMDSHGILNIQAHKRK